MGTCTHNMCAMINYFTLIKHNIRTCASGSIYTFLSGGIREHHQLVLLFDAILYPEVRLRCILYSGISFYSKILVIPNVSQQVYQYLKCTLLGFDEKKSKFCTAKHKFNIVDKR